MVTPAETAAEPTSFHWTFGVELVVVDAHGHRPWAGDLEVGDLHFGDLSAKTCQNIR